MPRGVLPAGRHCSPKQLCKWAFAVLSAVVLTAVAPPVPAKAVNVPDTVRVGLYYRDNSVNTAQSILDMHASAGMLLGFHDGGGFTEIFRVTGSSAVFVRKDGYYYNSGSGLKEYNPDRPPASGEKYGPFHIRLIGGLPDAASARSQAEAYRQAGIQAYVVYEDSWQVWMGFYVDEQAALSGINDLKAAHGDLPVDLVRPSQGRVVAVDSQYLPLCVVGGSGAYFQARPAPENDPPVIYLKGRPYRGAIEVKRLAESDMTVINVVTMQEYLYGNVPPEIGGNSPIEAIKAQAVASKMYAINNMGKHGRTGFDLCATTGCQVYKGYEGEVPRCNQAIDEVKDKIITYNGAPAAHIYYFASGGGSTEDVVNVWGSSYPYLVSVEDKYEKIYTWTKTLRASDVRTILPDLGSILGISITRKAKTGRVTQLAVRSSSRGEPVYFTNEKCRTLFGLDSQLYTIITDADVFAAGVSYSPQVDAEVAPAAVASAGAVPAGLDVFADTVGEQMGPAGTDNTVKGGNSASSSQIGHGTDHGAAPAQEGHGAAPGASETTTGSDTATAGISQESHVAQGGAPVMPGDEMGMQDGTSGLAGQGTPDGAGGLDGTHGEAQAGQIISTPPAIVPAVSLPVCSIPERTQLGGKMAVTADGVGQIKGSNNKVAILGADGKIKKAAVVPETYTFSGKGWGHAVGMSQAGAIGMAKAGFTYDQILMYYFKGTKVE